MNESKEQYTDVRNHPLLLGRNLKILRQSQEMTLQQCSELTGLSRPFLSQVESGKRGIRTDDLRRLLRCYDYSLGRFISEAQDPVEDRIEIAPQAIVQTRRHKLLLDGSRAPGAHHIFLLRPVRSDADAEFLDVYLPPRSQMTEDFIELKAEVRGVVLRGILLLVQRGDEYIVREGEEFCFDGSLPHFLRNYTGFPVHVLLVINPAVF